MPKRLVTSLYIQRGKIQKRRGRKVGQIKAQEKYLHSNELLLLRGGDVIDIQARENNNNNNIADDSDTVLLIPTPLTACIFLPIFEQISNIYSQLKVQILFLETVLSVLIDQKDGSINKTLKQMLFDSIGCLVLFNEQFEEVYSPQRIGLENIEAYSCRLFLSICLFIKLNLTNVKFIILAADISDPVVRLSNEFGLTITYFKEYIASAVVTLSNLLPKMVTETDDLLSAYHNKMSGLVLRGNIRDGRHQYPAYYSPEEINRGVQAGVLLVGELYCYKHDNSEGEIELRRPTTVSGMTGTFSMVLISGRMHINRALNRDLVVVRILPRHLWGSTSKTALKLAASDTYNDDDDVVLEGDNEILYDSEDTHNIAPGAKVQIPYVEVVGIQKRQTREIIAYLPPLQQQTTTGVYSDTYEPQRNEYILVIPLDRKLPKVRIRTRHVKELAGRRFAVAVDDWPRDSKFPNGHLLRVLGEQGDWRMEIECLLLEHSITPKPFSPAALACLPPLTISLEPQYNQEGKKIWVDSNYELPASEIKGRRDFRESRVVFSVDPPGCQDIDDAMSLHWIRPGLVEIGVHIADVCAFVPLGSALDQEAREKATTVYLTHERFDMLPSLISSDIASLHEDKDRFTMSVLWEVEVLHASDGSNVQESEDLMSLDEADNIRLVFPARPSWIGRGIIHSVSAATYQQAHNLIYDLPPDSSESRVPRGQAGRPIPAKSRLPMKRALRGLTVVARILQRGRESAGALDLTQGVGAELKFKLDMEGSPVEVAGKGEMEIHHTISELMVAANSAVAQRIYEAFPIQTLLRIHPPPSSEKLALLQNEVKETGLTIFQNEYSSSELRQQLKSYREKVARQQQSGANKSASSDEVVELLTSAVIRSMTEAKYVCSSTLSGDLLSGGVLADSTADGTYIGHYGLGLRYYTHFTSPIRRYADVVVHHQLLHVLAIQAAAADQVVSVKDKIEYSNRLNAAEKEVKLPSKLSASKEESAVVDADEEDDFLDSLLDGIGDELAPTATATSAVSKPAHTSSVGVMIAKNTCTSNEDNTSSLIAHSPRIIAPLPPPPFSTSQLVHIADHLNVMNRRAKACQMGCQKLFLCLYFSNRVEKHVALIYALRENGFLAYLPAFNHKGPVYLNKDGRDELHLGYACTSIYEDDRIAELHVLQTAGNSSSKSKWRLQPMMKVMVEVSADSSRYLRELTLTFLTVVHADTKVEESCPNLASFMNDIGKNSSDRTKPTQEKRVFEEVKESSLFGIATSALSRRNPRVIADSYAGQSRSQYVSLVSATIDTPTQLAQESTVESKGTTGSRVTKLLHQTRHLRHNIKGTGRFAFGLDDDVKAIYKDMSGIDYEAREKITAELATAPTLKGYSAARLSMEKWGEEWADEEDLPYSSYNSETASSNSTTASNAPLAAKYAKDVSISTQRLAKLKVAMRKSKYDG